MEKEVNYEYGVVQGFALSALFWGVIGVLIGILIAFQLVYPELNFAPWLTYGRLRVVHTNGLAFGFGLGAIFGMFYYITQRLAKAPLPFPKLARVHLWLFNAAIAAAAVTLLLGYSQAKEYAELEWPLDIGVVVIWVMFAVNIIGTILNRKEKQMYVSLWYILATIVTVAVLYILNNLAIPVGLLKSYSVYAGVDDANVQWWYGHNAVGFVFTTPILAMFYYVLPKATGAPIFSHRLSIIGFWALIFGYLWTGAHHLVYTPVPDWIQTTAIVFSIFLIAPSWASVVNGYYTINGRWDQMRSNYLIKFLILGITFYGLQTIQGPSQAIRAVSQVMHYTDYLPGHVHMGTMGWVALTASAAIYYVIERVYKTEVYSVPLANAHFWLALIGQLIFSVTMWFTGLQQGLMMMQRNADGTLAHTFMEALKLNYPFWIMRGVGGVIFFLGFAIFVYNILMTIQKGKRLGAAAA
ncbi:MAG: cbb3-type cytochrome c oxidase subunit I [Nitrospirae bacterium]|nr:cbb3-type cytochrome c oxidase subunit I [Nitrospirota bacterium]